MISTDDFTQTFNLLSGHVSITVVMPECDSKYKGICFNKCSYKNLSYMNIELICNRNER